MTSMHVTERARRAEDDYFRRKDAELIERATRGQAAGDDSAAGAEHRALAQALGVREGGSVERLYAAGFRPANVALLDWLPAIDVAWADGLDMIERHALRSRIAADPRADHASLTTITEWLFVEPAPELMDAARDVLRQQLATTEPPARRARLDAILARCEAVGEASGGIWLVGAVSGEERRRISAVRVGLAEADNDAPAEPYEFPH